MLKSNRQTDGQTMINKNIQQIRFLENSLLINNKILVFGDFHIGYEEYLFGKLLPIRVQLEEILKRLDNIFSLLKKDCVKISEIVILGDLKHEFGEISESEWRETLELLDYLLKKTEKIVLVKGNHDNILGPIAKKRGVELRDYYIVDKVCFMHGDKMFKECEKCDALILGHLHPAVNLHDEWKKEKFNCFLRGKWKKREVYIVPSFVPLFFGYDLKNLSSDRRNFSFINNKELKNFEVIIYNEKEDKEYNFGRVRKMMR